MSLLTPIEQGDAPGLKLAKLQRWLRLAVDNAGITYTMSGLLTNIEQGDVDGLKFAKLGAWMKLLAENIGGGGGTGNVRSATIDLDEDDATKAIVFNTPFAGGGVPDVVPTVIPPAGGDAISAWIEEGSVTNNGATVAFSSPIPAAGYQLTYVANKE